MRQAAGLVFDEVVDTETYGYTSTELNELLGTADHMALQVVVDDAIVPHRTTMRVGVWIETSADGANWAVKSATLEVPHFIVDPDDTTVSGHCYDANAIPSMKLVRLRVMSGLTPSGVGTGTAHVRVYVTLRDTGGRPPAKQQHHAPPPASHTKSKDPDAESQNIHIYQTDSEGHPHRPSTD